MNQRTIELAKKIQSSTDKQAREELIAEFARQARIAPEDAQELFQHDVDLAYIQERLLLYERGALARSREELVALVQKIINGEGTVAETDEWLRIIGHNVSMPISKLTDLIFYPEEGRDPDAARIVDKALSYKRRIFQL